MVAHDEITLENPESRLADIVLADPQALHLDAVALVDDMVVLTVTSTQVEALCPVCRQPSAAIHSSYVRSPSDLAVAGHPVRLQLHVRRFFCVNLTCVRKTFAERLPGILKPFARRTTRLANSLCGLAQALGGEAGSRRAAEQATPVSPDTLLRLLGRSALPTFATPTVLGVDDWALRKGQRYGTILVDLERQRVVDLLPERSADSLAQWLQQHPGVQIISRDRGTIYAEGARRGAPAALQVADRFHLLSNLRAGLEPLLSREPAHLPKIVVAAGKMAESAAAAAQAVSAPMDAHSEMISSASNTERATAPPGTAETPSLQPLTRLEQIKQDRRRRRQTRYHDIIALQQQGWRVRRIARELGVGRRTVHRYVTAGHFPEIATRQPMPSILDRFEPYLRQRWQEGCHNAMQLFREIQAQGFTGSRPSLSRWAVHLRQTLPQPGPSEPGARAPAVQQSKSPPEKRRKLSPAQAAWLLVSRPEELKAEEQVALTAMRAASTEIATAYDLAQAFAKMVREHTAEGLPSWLKSAKSSCLAEMRSFANGIEQDLAAVTAGLSLKWSQGQVEGQVNRLKLVKPLMYGRANFDLLKKRVLVPI